jgi:diadenosine tetraphosphate (Ap4A) HIT family hydrolase/ubiquinone/menaquinone biosynthesis C-methylase UbiE
MTDCIFCRIAAGEAKAWRVYEDENTVAFLDIHPASEYHTLVIPKRHYVDIFDLPAHELGAVSAAIKKVTRLYRRVLGLRNVQIINSSGAEAQQDVFHFHAHIVPRHAGDGQDVRWRTHPEWVARFDQMLARLAEPDGAPTNSVQGYYDENADAEWARLARHRTEFAVSLRALEEFLPAPPGEILDIGGGPGRYAIALAARGYTVTLADLSQANLDLVQEKARETGVQLRQVLQADARDLGALPGEAFDAVLLMGPLYHLLSEADRLQAVQEALRTLKPGGVLCATFISRFAQFRDAAINHIDFIPSDQAYTKHILATGVHDRAGDFTKAYFAHPTEIVPFMESAGLETLGMVGCEGIVAGHEDHVNSLTGQAWEQWVALNYRLGSDPAAHGAADHLLYIGRKPAV